MKVAVIGAGAAGLCCARHLSKFPQYFQFQVFEECSEVGGTWVYSPLAQSAPSGSTFKHSGVHSSAYKNLRTNLPKEVMFFPDFPFPSHLPSFLTREDVLKYLNNYAQHFKLNSYIKFRTLVEQVKPIFLNDKAQINSTQLPEGNSDDYPYKTDDVTCNTTGQSHNNGGQLHDTGIQPHGSQLQHEGKVTNGQSRFQDVVKWMVTSVEVETGKKTSEEFDAVLICNGHFSEPYIPAIAGLSLFTGHVSHSHVYREPEVFRNQRVLVVGSGQSGRDIVVDLSAHAKQVYLCNRGKPLSMALPDNVEELPEISEIRSNRMVVFIDSKERLVDSIILATGYVYSFPFLSEDSGLVVREGRRVVPLYKQTFNSTYSSMAIIGINFGFTPFPYFDYQVRWVLSVWAGSKTLPAREVMIRDEEKWYQRRVQEGIPPHKAGHYLGPAQWELVNIFAELGGLEPQAPVIRMMYNDASQRRHTNLLQYRSTNYKVLARDKWILC